MAFGAGKDFLIKMGNGATPEVFTTIAGMKATSAAINNEMIDTTNKDNPYWRQLASGGIKHMSLSASGIMKDAQSLKDILTAIMSQSGGDIKNFRLVSGLGYSFQGAFFVAGFDPAGDVGKEETYSLKLESAGDITFSNIP